MDVKKLEKESDAKAEMKNVCDKIKDKPAFVADIIAVMVKQDPSISKKFEEVSGTIKDVKIDGDKATATVVSKDKSGKDSENKLLFKKEKDGWKIDLMGSMGMSAR